MNPSPRFNPSLRRLAYGLVLGAAIALSGGCDGERVSNCSCVAEIPTTWFDSLDIPSLVGRSDSLRASVVLPSGCTEHGRIQIFRRQDTLWLVPWYKYSPLVDTPGVGCAHGPISAPIAFRLDSTSSLGANWISYPTGKVAGTAPDDTLTVSVAIR